MRNDKLKIEFCDFDEINQKNAKERLATKKCAICSKFACDNENCKGVADPYGTIQHLPPKNYSETKYSFICSECWGKAHIVSSEKISKGIYIHASGSSWAIRLGEYIHKIYEEKSREVNEAFVNEIRRLIKLSKTK